MALFQKTVEQKYLKQLNAELIQSKYLEFKDYFGNTNIQDNIRNSKEEQFQEGFLRELFVKILGYTLNPTPNFNLTTEYKNIKDSKKADGAIILDVGACSRVTAVIELKGTNTTDLSKIEAQAFGYKNNQHDCVYVVTSNFEKLRFYIDNAIENIEFNLFNLTKADFEILYLCLSFESIEKGIPKKVKEESLSQEDTITKKLYQDYSLFKRELHQNLVSLNPQFDSLTLFKKSQKLLDRFLFLFFAEDRQLLPPNSVRLILNDWRDLQDRDVEVPLYDRFKKYFEYLNTGYKGKRYDVFAYNGGLFKPDEILDTILIDDELLFRHTYKLSEYNFASEVDVNILGHIFENSLNELDELTREQTGKTKEHAPLTKRKKDGVFYTPKYITKYIVENTVGKLCTEKKDELQIIEEEYTTRGHAPKTRGHAPSHTKALYDKLKTYQSWLLQLTICDPACGSGAFLNQALDFLMKEHSYIDELQAKLLGVPLIFSDYEKSILENNLFGVDLNEESVEIAKLSLWLRTAQPNRKLNDLNSNIKCGNSLIDDPAVAGDKAFNWHEEFPTIFKKKEKKIWHVTTATHNSRYSQRMFDNFVKMGEPVWLSEQEELIVTETISEIVKTDGLNIVAYNICGDHAHIIVVGAEEEIPKIVQKLKAMSARACNIAMGRTVPTEEHAPLHYDTTTSSATEHAPLHYDTILSRTAEHAPPHRHAPLHRGQTQNHLWASKFDQKEITTNEQYHNTIAYIQNNRKKHNLPESKALKTLISQFTCSKVHAMRKEYTGGFDVVIGNPPYVRAELLGFCRDYLAQTYSVFNPSGDLFSYFYEKSFQLLKPKTGIFGFISNTFDKTTAGVTLRHFLQNNVQFVKFIDFTEVQIFEGATTYPVILIAQNNFVSSNLFSYIKIPQKSQNIVIDIDIHSSIDVTQILLNEVNWNFKSDVSVALIDRLLKNKTIRQIYGKCYYGVKTALNEAFIIPKKYQVGDHVKPIYEGKEIEKWTSKESVQQLILFQSKWTKTIYGDGLIEEQAKALVINDFPDLMSHILPLEENAKKRFDKGDYYWELRNCAYYHLFENPKIVFPNLQNKNKFAFDESGAYINAPAVILPTTDKFLTAILNSKLIWYFLTSICVVRNGGYIEVKPQYFEQIPLPQLSTEEKEGLNELAERNISNTKQLQETTQKFQRNLQREFNLEKLSGKLENWFQTPFNEFLKELEKSKVKLTLSQKAEWEDYFLQESKKALAIKHQIDTTDKEIDLMVYALYGLTEDEIAIVENSNQ